jgi:hypothetical protein
MSRVMELEDQIKKLQEEKSKIYSEERAAALSDIKGKIALFDFSAKELGFKLEKSSPSKAVRRAGTRGKKAAKKTVKKGSKKAFKSSGIYFDLDGKKIPAGRGRPPKEVSVYAAEKGVTTDSLKRNADGTPVVK